VGPPEDVGDECWPSPAEGDVLGDWLGDADPTLGLGEALGFRFGSCGFANDEDGVGEDGRGDGTSSGAGGEVGAMVASFEFGAADAAGEVVAGVGPMHGVVELVVDDVVLVLAGLPDFPPL
jgi:hypothetical protein